MESPLPAGSSGQADEAARHAGVAVELLRRPAEMGEAAALFEAVWGAGEATANLLKAFEWTGNYVSGARSVRTGALVGAAFGFVAGPDRPRSLHSHVAAVAAGHQGAGVGYALKCHQRAWAIAAGLDEITWTFDPLVRRNGWFNLVKLGAVADAYHVDLYGRLPDEINGGEETDRCVARWRLSAPPCSRPWTDGGVTMLSAGPDGGPVVVAGAGAGTGARGAPLLCEVPDDIVALRRSDPDLAGQWRLALRQSMGRAMADGFAAVAMTPDGRYVLVRAEP